MDTEFSQHFRVQTATRKHDAAGTSTDQAIARSTKGHFTDITLIVLFVLFVLFVLLREVHFLPALVAPPQRQEVGGGGCGEERETGDSTAHGAKTDDRQSAATATGAVLVLVGEPPSSHL